MKLNLRPTKEVQDVARIVLVIFVVAIAIILLVLAMMKFTTTFFIVLAIASMYVAFVPLDK